MQRARVVTLRVKLIVTLLAVALTPLLILTLLNKRTTEAALRANANRELFGLASQTRINIDTFMDTNLDAVRVEAVVPVLARFLRSSPEDRRGATENEAMAVLNGLIRKDSVSIVSYALLDHRGMDVLDTKAANIGKSEAESDHFRQAMKTGLPHVSRVVFSGAEPLLSFSSPVRDPNRQETVGVLRLSYDVAVLQQIVKDRADAVESKPVAILLDEHHIRLAHSQSQHSLFKSLVPLEPSLFERLRGERRLPDRPVAELSTDLRAFDEGLRAFDQEKDPDTTERRFLETRLDGAGEDLDMVAFARLERVPWTVAFIQPERVFFAPIEQQTRNALILALLIAGVVTVVAVLMGQILTRPIIRLARAASELAGGKLDTAVEVRSRDEMGILAESFNQMALRLRESFAILEKANEDLEDRVAERTAELNDAKVTADAANKAKGDFLANMSHELRTPLNGVLGYAQILRRSKRLDEADLRGIDVIYHCGSHLLTLINDVLDLSKIEAQTMELHPNDFYFPSFLRSTVEICRVRAEQKGVVFFYKPARGLPGGVRADEKRLRQVLLNLMGNAVKFTEQGSVTLTVTVLEDGAQEPRGASSEAAAEGAPPGQRRTVRFEVEDTGPGIGSDQLGQIFLPFKQAGEVKRRAEGTGLGLAISQRIARMMGSEIQVRSELGKGSVFWLDVELTDSLKWMQGGLAAQPVVAGYAGKRRKIMVVDDIWENRAVLVGMLQAIGFEVVETTNGQEGLEQAAAAGPDLVITDLVMPVLDGFGLMQGLRRMPELQGLPILASSASAFSADRQKSLDAGADDFIAKPVQMDELLQKMQRCMSLEWIYEQQGGADAEDDADLDPDSVQDIGDPDVAPPSAEVIATLLDLSRRGLVNQIRKYVDGLDEADPKLAPFADYMRRLARDFRLDAMERFLEKSSSESVRGGATPPESKQERMNGGNEQ
jgi:signal transduction histidine kinase/FixJ family two-component response regulator